MKKPVLVAVMALLLFGLLVSPVFATLQEKLEEQKEVGEQLAEERKKAQTLEQQIKEYDRELAKLRAELARLAREIEATELEIAAAEEELAEAEALLDYRESLFKRRLRAIYKQGYVTYLEVLVNATSFADFLTRLNNMKIIAAKDLCLVNEIQAERDRIEQMKQELEEKRNNLEGMRRETLSKESEVERIIASRQKALAEVEANIRAMEEERERIAREIQQLFAQGHQFQGNPGKFDWPMAPPMNESAYPPLGISSGFGYRTMFGETKWHGAIDIAPLWSSNYPNDILAAEDGVVVFSGAQLDSKGNYAGYGNYIRISHGGNIVTLYAHLSKRLVSNGDVVYKGQPIGKVGNTGYSFGAHLHFEVYDFNVPSVRPGYPSDRRQNPMNYF